MIPDFDIRIASLVKAIEDNILPSIESDRPLAREQASLVIGHLKIMAEQWAFVESHAVLCLKASLAFARDLLGHLQARPTLAPSLRRTIELAEAARPVGARAVMALRDTVAAAASDVISRAADLSDDLWEEITPVVLQHARHEHDRERAWFAGFGMDSEAMSLPAIADLFVQQDFLPA
jgi:hypothetical protein